MERMQPSSVLLVRVHATVCSLPISEVIETMRPLPVTSLSDVPPFVRGLALIRGVPTPVIELGALFQSGQHTAAGRFVLVRCGERTVALSVQSVIGVVELDASLDHSNAVNLPPLLKNARTDVIEAIRELDAEFLVMLNTARLVPESLWDSLGSCEGAR
jgi:purine-binding chemotaxis protein CheW